MISVLLGVLATVLSGVWSGGATAARAAGQPASVRALWVDAFHDGIKSPAQVQKLVTDARRANINTLVVQVRRRGDVYYVGGPEPLAADQAAGYDALRTLVNAARSGSPRLEVQAWIPVYPIWSNRAALPSDLNHVFNRHGPSAQGEEMWLMTRDDGETWANDGYWLDPGHPGVQAYLIDLATDLVRRYEVDGIALDRIRYYEGSKPNGGPDRRWGYNPTSVMRFDWATGRAGQPEPNDPAWAQYRRDRVSDFLRELRSSVLAVRPELKVSAAVLPTGRGPGSDADWANTLAYSYIFQDWRAWLEWGLLDQAFVMNYSREANPTEVAWLDQWLAFERTHTYGRQVVPTLALYLNQPPDIMRQIRRVLSGGQDGSRLSGVGLYSYATPDLTRYNGDPGDDTPDGYVWDLLTRPFGENDQNPPFPEPSSLPGMSWRN
jgi:uncharacterized lipoprotein YddW (UPF0748 family)